MACSKDSLWQYLADFSAQRPLEAVYCAYGSEAGAGMGTPVFALFFFGFIGLALTVRTQHPGPIVVAGMLSAGVIAPTLPSAATQIMFLVFMFTIGALGLYLLRKARASGSL